MLCNKYGNFNKEDNPSKQTFALSYSNHVRRGEAFELIDGDNLRFFDREIDALLSNLYEEQTKELAITNRGGDSDEKSTHCGEHIRTAELWQVNFIELLFRL